MQKATFHHCANRNRRYALLRQPGAFPHCPRCRSRALVKRLARLGRDRGVAAPPASLTCGKNDPFATLSWHKKVPTQKNGKKPSYGIELPLSWRQLDGEASNNYKAVKMSEAKDTLLRLLALLRLIPELPRYTTSSILREKLRERGFSVDLRTVQRDLSRLEVPLCLSVQEDEKGRLRWSHSKDTPLDLRDMEPSTALALYLAESHLKSVLPQSILDLLQPQFRKAHNYLDDLGNNDLAHWARRVRAKPNGKALAPAQVDADIWRTVSVALLERKQLRIDYLSRSKSELKSRLIHPAGLISRHSISYLIATVDGYSNQIQFALHRIKHAECLDTPATEDDAFDIDHYLRDHFNALAPIKRIELIADVAPEIAWLLSETPLSSQQTLEPLPDSDWQRLRAQVPDDQETLWWVFGLGENIRVQEPISWIETIKSRLEALRHNYGF